MQQVYKNMFDSKSKRLSLDNACHLITNNYVTNSFMQEELSSQTETIVFCAECPITSNEFFKAGQSGIKSEKMLVVDSESYGNQTIVKYNDVLYAIYRVYPRADGMTELYLAEKSGV